MMKHQIFILIVTIGLFGCNYQPKKAEATTCINPNIQSSQIDNSAYYTRSDTVLITTELGKILKFEKNDFNNIIDSHSEFFEVYPSNPDQAYFNSKNKERFGSEAGQDEYYILYAHFLKQRNGVDKFAIQRQKLIDIYLNINSLFGNIEYGGTYFGHQNNRILGYAEYSIYLQSKTKDELTKTYDISKQKGLYIKSLRQIIEDESQIDNNTIGQEKFRRNEELNRIVNKIDGLITDLFLLRRAQEFQYEHYEIY